MIHSPGRGKNGQPAHGWEGKGCGRRTPSHRVLRKLLGRGLRALGSWQGNGAGPLRVPAPRTVCRAEGECKGAGAATLRRHHSHRVGDLRNVLVLKYSTISCKATAARGNAQSARDRGVTAPQGEQDPSAGKKSSVSKGEKSQCGPQHPPVPVPPLQ